MIVFRLAYIKDDNTNPSLIGASSFRRVVRTSVETNRDDKRVRRVVSIVRDVLTVFTGGPVPGEWSVYCRLCIANALFHFRTTTIIVRPRVAAYAGGRRADISQKTAVRPSRSDNRYYSPSGAGFINTAYRSFVGRFQLTTTRKRRVLFVDPLFLRLSRVSVG